MNRPETSSTPSLHWLDDPERGGLRRASLPPVPERHRSGKVAVVGHTPQKNGEVLDLGYLKCIDTFCHGGAG